MTQQAVEIDTKLRQIFESQLQITNYDEEMSMLNVESWDSLAQVGLVLEIERQFNIKFSASDFVEMVSIRAIKDILMRGLNQ